MSCLSGFIRDATARCCPECSSPDVCYQRLDPAPYGHYTRDYECQNCGCEWMMEEPEVHYAITPAGREHLDGKAGGE